MNILCVPDDQAALTQNKTISVVGSCDAGPLRLVKMDAPKRQKLREELDDDAIVALPVLPAVAADQVEQGDIQDDEFDAEDHNEDEDHDLAADSDAEEPKKDPKVKVIVRTIFENSFPTLFWIQRSLQFQFSLFDTCNIW